MGTEEKICGICLKICDDFMVIGDDMNSVLDIVLPKIDFITAIRAPVMCINCTEMLTKCFDFKKVCFYAHDYIFPFVNDKDSVKLDLKEVYFRKNENATRISEDQDVCGLCVSPVKKYFSMRLDAGEGDLMKIIKQCLPELDLSSIEKPVICPSCCGSLEHCFGFVTTCSLTENKIGKYRNNLDINSKGQIELSSVLQFTIKDEIKTEIGDTSIDEIKVEEQFCEEIENADERKIGNEDDTFKLKETFHEERDVEMEEKKCLVNEETEIKTDDQDINRFQDVPTSSQSIEIESAHNYQNASGFTKYKHEGSPKTHMLTHRELSEVMIYRCNNCSYTTKLKRYLPRHMLTHRKLSKETVYKCASCSYETERRNYLKTHLLIHRKLSEITVYRCNVCSYVARQKGNLRVHMLIHRELSEVTAYRCERCTFITRRKGSLKEHMLTHPEDSEVARYRCASCLFVTKHKAYLTKHMLVHRKLSEVTGHRCNSCSYVGKRKSDVKTHMLTHRKLSEITVYRCNICSFVAKQKGGLKTHMLTHRKLSEITVYRCNICSYVARQKGNLKAHVLTHRELSK